MKNLFLLVCRHCFVCDHFIMDKNILPRHGKINFDATCSFIS